MYPIGMAPAPLVRDLIGHRAGYLLPLLAGIAAGVALACVAGRPPWGDQSMYLVAAGKALDGLEIGRDIIDVNPPLIIWLSEIPVALARVLGVLPQTAMQALLALLTGAILVWCLALIRRSPAGDGFVWWLAGLLLYATTIHPWYHLGTREHLLLLFLLPYLFMAAARLSPAEAPRTRPALVAGLFAAAAAALKPQHLLVVFAVEALLVVRWRSLRPLLRPEIAGLVAGSVVHALAVLIFAPDYLRVVVPFAVNAYLDRDLATWSQMIGPARAAKVVLAVAVWLIARRISGRRELADVFMVAAFGAASAYVLQRKGYEYQLVPTLAFFHLGVGIVLAGTLAPLVARGLTPATRRGALIAAAVPAVLAFMLYYPFQAHRAPTYWTNDRKEARAAIVPHIPSGTTVFMISPVVGPIHDGLLRHDLRWGSRFTVMFMAEALVTRDLGEPRNAALARWTTEAVVEDLQRYRPSVVLVERCQDPSITPCGALGDGRSDFLGWFLKDDAFRATWTRYARQRRVGPYDIWCATDDRRACPALLAEIPPS